MTTEPVRWGILSTALIGTQKVIPALLKSPLITVAAIASRSLPAAQAAAQSLGISTAHGSYQALLADPQVEVVYNPLPNHLHVPLTLAAVQAGKHVLCEKPFSITAAELDVLRPYATKVHIGEAFMVRHHPQWHTVRDEVRQGAIGELRSISVRFSYFNDDPGNIRNQADIGGGALYDIGGYAIVAGRWFFEADPEAASATLDRDPQFHTDRSASGWLAFSGGRQMAFSVSTQSARFQRVELLGTRGRIEIEIPFNATQGAATRYAIDDTRSLEGAGVRWLTVPPADQYLLQAEAFSRAVREEAPGPAGLNDAVMNMRTIEALFASAASGRAQRL